MSLVGTRIGSYVVERELGSGGTGTVYLCRHTMIERDVAVKVLHDDQAMDPDAIARFFQEAKAAAEIGHPNIITIIDFGEVQTPAGPRAFLMMEALSGQSLDKRLRTGGLSLADIGHILEQCCSALAASHGKGIIHRDLKPANVFLCNESFDPLYVKLLDFGTAKLTAPTPEARRTQFGMVLGTPAFMSPEQCEGRGAVDQRSDIYSLGVMLYQMLTGTVPFDGDVREMMLAHLHEQPAPPSARNPAVPPAWEALCLHMMEKDRTARFQSITEVAQALADLEGHAAVYRTDRVRRTQVLPGVGSEGQTLHVSSPSVPPIAAPRTPRDACAALCTGAFLAALLFRLEARWYEVTEVCRASGAEEPTELPRPTHVTWIQHPSGDPALATVVFLHVATGWSVTLSARTRC